MAQPFLAGVDIGSTGIKAILFDRKGGIRGEAYRQTPLRTERRRSEFPVRELTEAALDAVAEIAGKTGNDGYVAGIAFASIGESFVLFDADGEPVDDIIAWYDRRAVREAGEVLSAIDADALMAITGLAADPIYSLCKLLWLRRHAPEAIKRAAGIALIADWLAFRVCAIRATDVSLASRTLLASPANGAWSGEMLRIFGFEQDFFPRMLPTGSPLGPPTRWAKQRLGLTGRCVVSVGGHDHIMSSISAGAAKPGLMVDSAGTAEAILRTGPRMVSQWPPGPLEFAQGGTWWAGSPRPIIYLIGAVYEAGGALERFRRGIGEDIGWDALIARAERAAPASAEFHRHRGAGLEADPAAWSTAVFSGNNDPGAQFRALLEGLALESRLLCDSLTRHAGLPPVQDIRLVGGLAKNRLYGALKAAAFDTPIRVAEYPQFTALGAAIAAGLGAGIYSSLEQALDEVAVNWREVAPRSDLVAAMQTLQAIRASPH